MSDKATKAGEACAQEIHANKWASPSVLVSETRAFYEATIDSLQTAVDALPEDDEVEE